MSWEQENRYAAKIGGIYYRNVLQPIQYKEVPILTISRETESRLLGISFEIVNENGIRIAQVEYNQINLINKENYFCSSGHNRNSIIEKKSGRVICDIKFALLSHDYELELSALLFTEEGYPIVLHPNRSKFGKFNDSQPPNISFLTLTTEEESGAGAISLNNTAALYLIGICIENFRTGISITSPETT